MYKFIKKYAKAYMILRYLTVILKAKKYYFDSITKMLRRYHRIRE